MVYAIDTLAPGIPSFDLSASCPRFLLTCVRVAVSSAEFPPSRDGKDLLLLLQGLYVVSARPHDAFQPGLIGLSEPQRVWMELAMTDTVKAELYDPFQQGDQAYLGSMDVEVGFASIKKRVETPYDQDELAKVVTQVSRDSYGRFGRRTNKLTHD